MPLLRRRASSALLLMSKEHRLSQNNQLTLEKAKQLVFDAGYEVVKDSESDYYRWRARNWVEESGLIDTEEEAYFSCVELNSLSEED